MAVKQGTCLTSKSQSKRTKVPNKGSGDWQFVNLCDSRAAKDPEYRKLVRVNAARDSWKKFKGQHPTSPASSFPPPCHTTLVPITDSEGQGGQSQIWGEFLFSGENDHWPTEGEQVLDEAQATCTDLTICPASPHASSPRQTSLRRLKTAFASSALSERQTPNLSGRRLMLDSGNRDPFDAYPVKCDSQNTQLLSHCR